MNYLNTSLSSFYTVPNFGESDLRSTYSVFVLCSLLNCWDAIDTDRALSYIRRCRVSERFISFLSAYFKAQGNRHTKVVMANALTVKHKVSPEKCICAAAANNGLPSGGTTFCALASLSLCPKSPGLSSKERNGTVRWLINQQVGGFRGRTGKEADACYSFWCGASLKVRVVGN